jgi:hypothetical protein
VRAGRPGRRTLAQPPLPSDVAPVASVIRLAKLRPLTGWFATSSGETFTPIFADCVSSTGALAPTVTISSTPPTPSEMSTVSRTPTPSTTSRDCAVKLAISYFKRYGPGPRFVIAYDPSSAETVERTAPVSRDVTVMVTPGNAALLWSCTRPVIRDSVCCATAVVTGTTHASRTRTDATRRQEGTADARRRRRFCTAAGY